MISAKVLGSAVEKFTSDNAPAILTVVGAAGSVGGIVLAVKATFKSAQLIHDEQERVYRMDKHTHEYEPFPKMDVVKLVWKEYIPTVGVGIATVGSIVCANRISTRRAAAMAVAYSLSEKAYSEYREKVVEKFNANKERQVRDEIAQDKVTASPPNDSQIIITGHGEVLCFDKPTARYFKSNMEKLRQTQNDLNLQVIETGQASLGDLYAALHLKSTPYSEVIGWTSDNPLELHFSAVLTDDSQPCISIDYYPKDLREGARFQEGCKDDPDF